MTNCGVERPEEEKGADLGAAEGLSGSRELIPLEGGLAVWAARGRPPGDPESGPGLLGEGVFRGLLGWLLKRKTEAVEAEEPEKPRESGVVFFSPPLPSYFRRKR